ncbi:hypothetical protein [Pseudomonas sp. PSE14]|uniref:hypothetical protein n=1 Tax=Pseudomonas sp. PSE14 TaxID=3016341 RepID=UPI0023D8A1C6|nr:hypothetical protein [Pseudomonas sp. PSE14]WEJ75093.1 hypothetical protein O6P39_11550 [Pseudomonas sp. PSE14]
MDTRQAVSLSKQLCKYSGVPGYCLACGGSARITAGFNCSNSAGVLDGCAPHALISSGRSISAHLVNVPLAILDHLVDGLLAALLLGARPGVTGSSGFLAELPVGIPSGLPLRIHARPLLVPATGGSHEQQQRLPVAKQHQ